MQTLYTNQSNLNEEFVVHTHAPVITLTSFFVCYRSRLPVTAGIFINLGWELFCKRNRCLDRHFKIF